ncbi:unnamed protein product, partial [Brachionus calyciflorus]
MFERDQNIYQEIINLEKVEDRNQTPSYFFQTEVEGLWKTEDIVPQFTKTTKLKSKKFSKKNNLVYQ